MWGNATQGFAGRVKTLSRNRPTFSRRHDGLLSDEFLLAQTPRGRDGRRQRPYAPLRTLWAISFTASPYELERLGPCR
jgi:hypothetical protein